METSLEQYVEKNRDKFEGGGAYYDAVFCGLTERSKAIIDLFASQTLDRALHSFEDDNWPTRNGAAELSQAYPVVQYLAVHPLIDDVESKAKLAHQWEEAVRSVGRHSIQGVKHPLPLVGRPVESVAHVLTK